MNKKRFLTFPFLLLVFLISSFINTNTEQNDEGEFVVVLDAGHGGHDPGNLGNGYLEKNIALNIVLNVGAILERTPGVKVIYTRKDDTFVDLYVRGEIANKANADLFVSVHCDSHTSDAHGAGTFVLGLHANKQNFEIAKKENSVIYLEDNYESRYADYDINSPESVIGLTIMQEEFLDQSISLAKTIQNNFANKLSRKDREVKQAGFIVLHQTFMPSVLVETGFLTNDDEGAYLNSRNGQSEMGTAIAEAIVSYRTGFQPDIVQLSDQATAPTPEAETTSYDPYDIPKAEPDVAQEVVKEASKTTENKIEKPAVAEQIEENTKEEAIAAVPGKTPTPIVTSETVAEAGTAKDVAEAPIDEVAVDQEIVLAEGRSKAPEVLPSTKEEATTAIKDTPVDQEIVLAKEQPKSDDVVKEATKTATDIEKPTEKKETIAVIEKPKANTKNIVFKVQLMASKKYISLDPSNFNGLNKLSKESYKEYQRYMYGSTDSYEQAKLLKSNADAKGYPTSYIVAYRDGVRIPTPEAVKLVSD